jgi:hypothetical protein
VWTAGNQYCGPPFAVNRTDLQPVPPSIFHLRDAIPYWSAKWFVLVVAMCLFYMECTPQEMIGGGKCRLLAGRGSSLS